MDNKEKNQIPIYFVDNNGLFDNFQDLRTLRVDYKIVASPIGTLKQKSKQNVELGQPFILDKYALTFLYLEKIIKIMNLTPEIIEELNKISLSFPFQVFQSLHKQNYYVMPGYKYGADFIIYEKDPELVHGKALIFLQDSLLITEANRISTIVKKDCYIAQSSNSSIFFSKIIRLKPKT